MPPRELDRTVQQSVLDRLIDGDPRISGDPPLTWSQSVRLLKQSLRRDLEWLLNTRRPWPEAPSELAELRRSVYHYGLPDITSFSDEGREMRQRLARLIEEAITMFEPRLSGVRVSLLENEGGAARELHLLVEGLLRMDPTPERIAFDTVLQLGSGEVQLRGDAGA